MPWKPHVTVAAVVERNSRFLIVEEVSDGQLVYNQPAGHLDEGESLIKAAMRETLASRAKIAMVRPETEARPGPSPKIKDYCREGHRQFAPQGKYRRSRR